MSDKENFSNNPFASLAGKLTPKDAPKSGDVRVRSQKNGKPASPKAHKPAVGHKDSFAHASIPMTDVGHDDESQLFLQAVQSVNPQTKDKKPLREDFALGQSVELPTVDKKKKKQGDVVASKVPTQTACLPCQHEAPQPVEEDAFYRAMREVTPLAGKGREIPPVVEPVLSPAQANNVLQDFLDGKLEFALSLTGEYLEGYVVGLDEVTMNKLRAGQYSPEAHLDLHGLNAVQAYQALVGFFRSAWYKGLRTVLLVPGRGRNSTDGFGVLRDKVQSWLTQEPFKRVVLAFCTARPVDGGPGSVYVLLRKYRKKGKIYWERMPADPDLF